VIGRAIIQVEGPPGGGKTTFVETLLGSTDEWILAARSFRDDDLDQAEEAVPSGDPELERYRRAGAEGVARFRFPGDPAFGDDLFESDLMMDHSDALVLEGYSPLEWVDLRVFVAPAPPVGSRLFVRRRRDRAKEQRERERLLEQAFEDPTAAAGFLAREFGPAMANVLRDRPQLVEEFRRTLLTGLESARRGASPAPVGYWAVNARYEGIERGQCVVITVRNETERGRAEGLVEQLGRLRKEKDLFRDIMGPLGKRTPITAVAADLRDPADPGTRKALARVKRTLRRER
jgi:hypothetical protein